MKKAISKKHNLKRLKAMKQIAKNREQREQRHAGGTLTCLYCGHRGQRETFHSRCPMCGMKTRYGNTVCVVLCALTLALSGPAMAQRGSIVDYGIGPYESLDTEETRDISELLPDLHYQSTWNFRTFQDSQRGISGGLFLIGGVSTHRDSTGNIGTTSDYGDGVTIHRDSTGNIDTTFDYSGYKTYQFTRPPLTRPDERD